jgi:hypothetical protein
MKKSDKQTSEDFDDFLTGEGMLDEVRDGAMKKVDAYRKKAERQISLNMAKNSLVLTPPPAVSDADRRSFLRIAALGGAGLAAFGLPDVALADDAVKAREMVRMQEKTDLILLTDRPPQLETPLHYFRSDLTPNDAFFVRWHLSGLRTTINPKRHTLNISGHVNTPLKVSLKQLRDDFEAVSVVAVNQCSGNSRGVFEPHVPGSQWGNGAMGNARCESGRESGRGRSQFSRTGRRPSACDASLY